MTCLEDHDADRQSRWDFLSREWRSSTVMAAASALVFMIGVALSVRRNGLGHRPAGPAGAMVASRHPTPAPRLILAPPLLVEAVAPNPRRPPAPRRIAQAPVRRREEIPAPLRPRPLRMELATPDPQVRIIWFVPPPENNGS